MKASNSECYSINNLASSVNCCKHEDIPERFQKQIKFAILDTMAVALAAQSLSDVRQMNLLYAKQSVKDRNVWWNQLKASPLDATFLNAYASHRLDFDNILYNTFGHPAIMILPALFSVYDMFNFKGTDLINATMMGLETMSILGMEFGWGLKEQGFHPTPILGGLAATAATGWMLGFSENQLKSALTLAGTTVSGFKSSFGTVAKPYQIAVASRDSLAAALVVQKNPNLVLEEKWIDNLSLLSNVRQVDLKESKFGNPWVLDQCSFMFKYYPCCGYFHHTMNELRRVLEKSRKSRSELQKVKLTLPKVIGDASIYDVPVNFNESQFSMPFNAGLIIAHEELKIEHFSEDQIGNPNVLWAMGLLDIEYLENEACLTEEGLLKGWIQLHFSDGKTFSDNIILSDYGTGSDFERLQQKFLQCASGMLNETQANLFLEWVINLEQTDANDWRRLQSKLTF